MYPVANPKVIERTRQFQAHAPIFIDTETTGMTAEDVVIEVGVVDLNGETLFETLVKPPISIPPEAVAVHGITDAMVADQPGWKDVWPQLMAVLEGRLVGVYNLEFDLKMIRQTHQRYWVDWPVDEKRFFCVMKLYAAFYGQFSQGRRGFRFHKLEAAGRACGIPLPNSHRAVDDARLTAALFNYMANYQS